MTLAPPVGIKLTTTDAVGLSRGIKCLVYGPAGIGKTRLCGSAPKPFIISAEGGLLSLRGQSIPAAEITELDQLNRLHDWLSGPARGQFHTLCLDSISEIAEKVLNNAKKNSKDGRMAYGVLADQMWQVVRAFRDIPGVNVIMTAKAEWSKDEASGITRWNPSMPGKTLTNGIAYYFDEVFCLNSFRGSTGEFRALQTQADLQYTAKDRSGALAFYEEPDMTKLLTKIWQAV